MLRILEGFPPVRKGPWDQGGLDYAIICSCPLKLAKNAQRLRKRGASVYTQFQGNRKAQLKRASANAYRILDFDYEGSYSVYRDAYSTERREFYKGVANNEETL